MCKSTAYPLGGNGIARLTFDDRGTVGGYVVRRISPTVIEVFEWSRRGERSVVGIPVDASSTFTETIVETEVAGRGGRTPYKCE